MIQIKHLECGYEDIAILHDVNLELSDSGFTALLGPNGAGKSTLLYSMMGYLKPKKGEVLLKGRSICQYSRADLAKEIAFIPQESHSEFDYSVLDTVLMGRYPYLDLFQTYGDEDRHVAEGALQRLDLISLKHRYLSELSGGEKQRVFIARALVQETKYILLDESLSQLDINFQLEIMHLLRDISTNSDKAILLISHNLNLAANYADRLIFLKQGRVLYSGTPNELMQSDKLAELFGVELVTSMNPYSGNYNIIYP